MRDSLGQRWSDRDVIFQRLISHLEAIPAGDLYRIGGHPYRNLRVDVSKVPGRCSHWRKAWLSPRLRYYPSHRVVPFLVIGFGSAYFHEWQHHGAQLSGMWPVVIALSALGVLTRQVQEAYGHYQSAAEVFAVAAFGNPRLNTRATALTTIIRTWGFRYTTTWAFSALLLALALP